jgi:hypothetical protein
VSTKNLNKGIGGQIREIRAYTDLCGTMTGFRYQHARKGKLVIAHEDELDYNTEIPEAYVVQDGTRISFKDTNAEMRTVKCNHGIIRILHLRHIPSLK